MKLKKNPCERWRGVNNKKHSQRKDIEEEIIKHNKQQFTIAVQSKVDKDKIYKKLDDKEMTRKILEGRLERNDCDNEELFEF